MTQTNDPFRGDHNINRGMLASLREDERQIRYDLAVAEQKLAYAATMRGLQANEQWKVVEKDLIELERLTLEECSTRQMSDYRQGKLHGILHTARMLIRAPTMSHEDIVKIEQGEIPALRAKLETCTTLLGRWNPSST